ncbi:MAG: hypothetical protein ACTSP9_18460 [Promethearchaeota archaeon]
MEIYVQKNIRGKKKSDFMQEIKCKDCDTTNYMTDDVLIKQCPDCGSVNIEHPISGTSSIKGGSIKPSTVIAIVLLIIGIIIATLTFSAIPALTDGTNQFEYFKQDEYWWVLFIPAAIFIVPAILIIAYKIEDPWNDPSQ